MLSVVVAGLIGLLALLCIGWETSATGPDRALLMFLAIGVGLGLTSLIFFVWLLLGAPAGIFPYAELVMLVLLAAGAFYLRRGKRWFLEYGGSAPEARGPVLGLVLALSVGCAVTAFVAEWMTNRQGAWDAWMTWNMHARALFRGGDQWREVLTALPAWSHPDYPLAVPGSVARIWTYVGQEAVLAPGRRLASLPHSGCSRRLGAARHEVLHPPGRVAIRRHPPQFFLSGDARAAVARRSLPIEPISIGDDGWGRGRPLGLDQERGHSFRSRSGDSL
jgi:hypothetical protein